MYPKGTSKLWVYFIFVIDQITGEHSVKQFPTIEECYESIGGKDNFKQDWNLSYHIIGHTKDNTKHVDITHFPKGLKIAE